MNLTTTTTAVVRIGSERSTELQSRVRGLVITPDSALYDEARQAFNRLVDQRPALILIAANAQDVAEGVRFARSQGLGVAIQSTGHGVILPADNAVMIITSQLRDLLVDASSGTAHVGAGLKWGEVLAETQKFGLAPLLGSSPGVGVVGYTLGGGLGWLGRKHGLACDSVLSFELVSADGQVLTASATENPDLFWGLRGGGGGFGIVTGMVIQLYPVDTVYGGNLFYPGEMAREVMQRYREWIRAAPDALTTSVVLMNYPPFPQVPEPLRGKSFVLVRGCFAGAVEEGEAHLKFWRDWKTPVIDDFKAMPFTQVAKISSDPVNPAPSKATGAWLRSLSDSAIDALIRASRPQDGPPALTVVEVRHAGGAIGRVLPGESAYSLRDSELLLFSVGTAATPEMGARIDALAGRMKQELAPELTGGVYMNFVGGMEARERTRDGYSVEAFQRLQALKAKYDPENIFGYSYAIAPVK